MADIFVTDTTTATESRDILRAGARSVVITGSPGNDQTRAMDGFYLTNYATEGGSIYLNGSQCLRLDTTPSVTGFSVGMWYQAAAAYTDNQRIFNWQSTYDKNGFEARHYGQGIGGEAWILSTVCNATTAVAVIASNNPLFWVPASRWVHVAFTYSGSILKMYLDGTLYNTSGAVTMTTNSYSFTIGGYSHTGNGNAKAWVKGFAFENNTTVWTAAQIASMYSTGAPPTSTCAYFPLSKDLNPTQGSGVLTPFGGPTFTTVTPKNLSVEGLSLNVSVYDSQKLRDYKTNYVINPTTESSTANIFNGFDESTLGTEYTKSSTQAYSGTSSLRFYSASSANKAARSKMIQVQPGKTYTFSAYLFKVTGYSGTCSLDIMEYDAAGTNVVDGANTTVDTLDTWTRISVTQTMSSTTMWVQVRFVNDGNSTGYAYADAWQFEEGSTASTYFDGSLVGSGWDGTANASTSSTTSGVLAFNEQCYASIVDSSTATELISLFIANNAIAISDSSTTTESIGVFITSNNLGISDSSTATESIEISEPQLYVGILDELTATESIEISEPQLYPVTAEDLTITESVSIVVAYTINKSDSSTAIETRFICRDGFWDVNKSESSTATEKIFVSRGAMWDAGIYDSSTVTEKIFICLNNTWSIGVYEITVATESKWIPLGNIWNGAIAENEYVTESISIYKSDSGLAVLEVNIQEPVIVYDSFDHGISTDGVQNYINLGTLGNLGRDAVNGFYIRFDIISNSPTMSEFGIWKSGSSSWNCLFIGLNQNILESTGVGQLAFYLKGNYSGSLRAATRYSTNFSDGRRHTLEFTANTSALTMNIAVDGVSHELVYREASLVNIFENFFSGLFWGGRSYDVGSGISLNIPYQCILDNIQFGTSPSNIYCSYACNDKFGTTVTDSIGVSNGTLSGSPVPVWMGSSQTGIVYNLSVSDSTTATESLTLSEMSWNITVSDSTTATDGIPYMGDTESAIEETSQMEVYLIVTSDSTTAEESLITKVPDLFVNVSDSSTATESLIIYEPGFNVVMVESTTGIESITILLPKLYINISDYERVKDTRINEILDPSFENAVSQWTVIVNTGNSYGSRVDYWAPDRSHQYIIQNSNNGSEYTLRANSVVLRANHTYRIRMTVFTDWSGITNNIFRYTYTDGSGWYYFNYYFSAYIYTYIDELVTPTRDAYLELSPVPQNPGLQATWYDAVMVEETTSDIGYFDGSRSDSTWTGTEEESESQQATFNTFVLVTSLCIQISETETISDVLNVGKRLFFSVSDSSTATEVRDITVGGSRRLSVSERTLTRDGIDYAHKKSISVSGSSYLRSSDITASPTGFCVGFWLYSKVADTSDTGPYLNNRSAWHATNPQYGFEIYGASNGRIWLQVYDGINSYALPSVNGGTSSGTAPVYRWNHIVVTFVPNSCILYVNGNLIFTDTVCVMGDPTGNYFMVGNQNSEIDHLVFQNTTTPWTQTDVTNLMSGIVPTGASWFNFDDNLTDQSGNGKTLSTVGSPTYSTNNPTALWMSVAYQLNVSDSTTATEEITVSQPRITIQVSDTETITEFIGYPDDVLYYKETVGVIIPYDQLAIVDASTATESITLSQRSAIQVSDSTTATESIVLVVPQYFPVISDVETVIDTPTIQLQSYNAIVSESEIVTENITYSSIEGVVVAEDETITESINLYITILYLAVADSSTADETVSGLVPYDQLVVSDATTGTENLIIAESAFNIMVSDSTKATESNGFWFSLWNVVIRDGFTYKPKKIILSGNRFHMNLSGMMYTKL